MYTTGTGCPETAQSLPRLPVEEVQTYAAVEKQPPVYLDRLANKTLQPRIDAINRGENRSSDSSYDFQTIYAGRNSQLLQNMTIRKAPTTFGNGEFCLYSLSGLYPRT